MTIRHLRAPLVLLATAGLLSCSSGAYVPPAPSMPAARAALRPEYRIFYDALQDYGDWVLIEPFGFVFRPKVDFATFRPYQEGFWVPNDAWGWVWISAEPFGWATYHYGRWSWDRFQGWVWTPGMDWGPAWVSWQVSDRYAGWTPLAPPGGARLAAQAPGGAYRYAPLDLMGSTAIASRLATRDQLGAAAGEIRPVDGLIERDGVRIHAGPDFAWVERARGGPLSRVTVEDVLGGPGRSAAMPRDEPAGRGIEAARRAGESAALATRSLIERGGRAPSVVPLVRPALPRATVDDSGAVKRPRRPSRGGAAPDSAR